jgi:hypothetical protein
MGEMKSVSLMTRMFQIVNSEMNSVQKTGTMEMALTDAAGHHPFLHPTRDRDVPYLTKNRDGSQRSAGNHPTKSKTKCARRTPIPIRFVITTRMTTIRHTAWRTLVTTDMYHKYEQSVLRSTDHAILLSVVPIIDVVSI